jgi:hypothetical protein
VPSYSILQLEAAAAAAAAAAAGFSKKKFRFVYETTQRQSPEDNSPHTHWQIHTI